MERFGLIQNFKPSVNDRNSFYIVSRLCILLSLIFTTSCNELLPSKPPAIQAANFSPIETIFWQNNNYLWIGNLQTTARLNRNDESIEVFPGINCLPALITYNPELVWCGGDRFDGKLWHKANLKVDTPIQTHDMMLWAGSQGGLAQFNPVQQEWIYVLREIGDITKSPQVFNRGTVGVHLFTEAQDGALWFYSYYDNAGINRWTPVSHKNWLSAGEDFMMIPRLQTSDGTIWATANAPYNKGLIHWDGQTWKEWKPFKDLSDKPDLIEAIDGTVWIATGFSEVGRWNGKDWRVWTPFPFSDDTNIVNIFQTQDKSIWAVSLQNEVSRWDGQVWQNWKRQEVVSQFFGNNLEKCVPGIGGTGEVDSEDTAKQILSKHIEPKHFLEGTNANIWFVLFQQAGISRWTGKCWRHYTSTDGLTSNDVSVLATSPDGVVWAGTRDAGVNFYNPETDRWQSFP